MTITLTLSHNSFTFSSKSLFFSSTMLGRLICSTFHICYSRLFVAESCQKYISLIIILTIAIPFENKSTSDIFWTYQSVGQEEQHNTQKKISQEMKKWWTIRNLQMKWNEAEMVALVGRRAADWEGKLTYRWDWFNSEQFLLFLQNRIRCTFILTQTSWQWMQWCQFLKQFHSGHQREEGPLLNSKDIRYKTSCSNFNWIT